MDEEMLGKFFAWFVINLSAIAMCFTLVLLEICESWRGMLISAASMVMVAVSCSLALWYMLYVLLGG